MKLGKKMVVTAAGLLLLFGCLLSVMPAGWDDSTEYIGIGPPISVGFQGPTCTVGTPDAASGLGWPTVTYTSTTWCGDTLQTLYPFGLLANLLAAVLPTAGLILIMTLVKRRIA